MAVLPPLAWRESPNQSPRLLPPGQKPYLVVIHRPVGSYHGSVTWLCDPRSKASAHIVSEHGEATQLVAWDRKAWHACAFNSLSYGLEIDDDAWNNDKQAFQVAARIAAYLCHKTGIPPVWSKHPLSQAGLVRHYDLGAAGGGHQDPTQDSLLWRSFVRQVHREHDRGGFINRWGRGRLVKL